VLYDGERHQPGSSPPNAQSEEPPPGHCC
jgi:hypothetical protein